MAVTDPCTSDSGESGLPHLVGSFPHTMTCKSEGEALRLFYVRPKSWLTMLAALVIVGALIGCDQPAASDPNTAGNHIQAKYDEMGKLTRLNYDRNKNGYPDTVAYMDGV